MTTTFLRVALSFAAVGGLLWLFARVARSRFGSLLTGSVGKARSEPLVVVDRRQLTRNTGVALIRAGQRHLLVGVGDGGVQLLTEGDDLAIEPASEPPGRRTSATIDLEQLAATDRTQSAGTRLSGASPPNPSRTSFIDALREKTVRRS